MTRILTRLEQLSDAINAEVLDAFDAVLRGFRKLVEDAEESGDFDDTLARVEKIVCS